MRKIDTKIIIFVLGTILLFLIIGSFIFSKKRQPSSASEGSSSIASTNAPVVVSYHPKYVNTIPTLPPSEGQGVNIDSQIVKDSESELKKLAAKLPYSRDFTTSNGVNISIVIPSLEEQDNSWTLLVQIFGPDYQMTSDAAEYPIMKNAFREGAQFVFSWLRNNHVDPNKVIIQWGDKKYIEDKAQEWLR